MCVCGGGGGGLNPSVSELNAPYIIYVYYTVILEMGTHFQ